ncbi:MAG: tRNA lysidine(34) synthetase TilS [Ruminococcus sp.]|nr:tRNA lysidine(34) synthetase TilS [Ruminococcus sp.]
MLPDKVYDFLKEKDMFNSGDRVLCALSGGADSTALLCVLCDLQKKLDISVCALHLNHNLRGEESDRDERFCVDLCKKLGVKLKVVSEDVSSYCKQNSLSTEEGARALRYKAFLSEDCDKIATAHTLNDSYETCLFNLARGTALKGLTGIPAKRGEIVRPFIEVTRQEIEEYLTAINQDFVTDSTNLTNDYKRNFIRHEIVPRMLDVNASALKSFKNTSLALEADEEYLNSVALDVLNQSKKAKSCYDIKVLKAQATAIQSRVIAMILRENSVEVSKIRIDDLRQTINEGKKINLSKGIFSFVDKDGNLKIGEEESLEWIQVSKPIELSKTEDFFEKTVQLKLCEGDCEYPVMDFDKIKGKIILRNRMSQDKVMFSHRQHTTLLKKAYNEKIAPDKRESNVILSDSEGIIFVENFSVAKRVAIDEGTKSKVAVIILKK